MSGTRNLGCVEFAVPGITLQEKLIFLRRRKMWLEVANDGTKTIGEVLDSLKTTGGRVLSVQAYRLHDFQPLSGDRAEARAAVEHIAETMKMASEVGASNVVTTVTYGSPGIQNAMSRCVGLFRRLGKQAEDLGVAIGLEPLGRNRTTFLPGLRDVVDLVRRVGLDSVRPMADTMHIYGNGDPVADILKENLDLLSEVQLRDTDSRPPGSGGIDFREVVRLLTRYRGLVCLEYRPGPDPVGDFERAVRAVGRR
ncbi:MAG: sugar phosphate isomerase/epimerase family protein [Candidatus Hadarchaeales archaeon]